MSDSDSKSIHKSLQLFHLEKEALGSQFAERMYEKRLAKESCQQTDQKMVTLAFQVFHNMFSSKFSRMESLSDEESQKFFIESLQSGMDLMFGLYMGFKDDMTPNQDFHHAVIQNFERVSKLFQDIRASIEKAHSCGSGQGGGGGSGDSNSSNNNRMSICTGGGGGSGRFKLSNID